MIDFNIQKVLNIVDQDKGMAKTLLEMTLDLGSADLKTMVDLTNQSSFQEAGKLAHKLKSSLATLGFTDVSELMKDLEQYAKGEIDPVVFNEKVNTIEISIKELFDKINHALLTELK